MKFLQFDPKPIRLELIDDNCEGIPAFRTKLGDLDQLKASIVEFGLLAPPVVWPVPQPSGAERYVVLDGNRRIAVLRHLQGEDGRPLTVVSCVVYGGSVKEARRLSILARIDGAVRARPNRGDEAVQVAYLIATKVRQVDLAAQLGHKQGWVSGCKKTAKRLAERAMKALREGKIRDAGAREILKEPPAVDRTPDENEQNRRLAEQLEIARSKVNGGRR